MIDKEKGEVGLSLTTTAKSKRTEQRSLLKANCQGTVNIRGDTEGKNTVIGLIGPLNPDERRCDSHHLWRFH